MKILLPLMVRLLALPALPLIFACGCTSVLWDKETFAHHYGPATDSNLRVSYSKERKDILVQYCESEEGEAKTRLRCYWLDPNTVRVNRNRRPHFASANSSRGLTPLPVDDSAPNSTNAVPTQLSAVIVRGDDYFTLYSGTEKLDPYKLPVYNGRSQRVKQVLLTPFTVAFDATVIGAVVGIYSSPQIFGGLNR